LISNAIKYTQRGFVKITTDIDNFASTLSIQVRDSGVGIPANQIKTIFTPFAKLMKNRNLNKEGVGLGLAVSKNLAIALGGDILVESTEGVGTKFTLNIPLKRCSESTLNCNSQQSISNPPVSRKSGS
jgi:signal transduction histidine kinase